MPRTKPLRVQIKIKSLDHRAGLPLPAYQTEGAAGMDLVAALPDARPTMLEPGARLLVPTGLILEIPQGYEGQVRPRSGLAFRHGVTVLNAPGTIDSDYRGELMVILINHGDAPFVISRGERIAQLVVTPVAQASFVEVEDLAETVRAAGGFGSTGRATADAAPDKTKKPTRKRPLSAT